MTTPRTGKRDQLAMEWTDSDNRTTRPVWLWPLPPLRPGIARRLDRCLDSVAPLIQNGRWSAAAALIGTVPLFVSYWLSVSGHQPLTAILLFPLFLACVRESRPAKALLLLSVTFLSHSALTIGLSAADSARAAPILPGAEGYWLGTRSWIETGIDPEYDVAHWVPEHVLLFAAVIGLSYCSLGLTVLLRGVYEVDLMNYSVGRLLAESGGAPGAILYGWHVWSVLRGTGYALIVYEIAGISLGALVGRDLGSGPHRRARLGLGIALLVLDGFLKFLLLDDVQMRLQATLL